MTKKELIKALEDSGIGFSKKATKAALTKLYLEHIDNVPKSVEPEVEEKEELVVKIKGYEASYISKNRKYTLGVFESEFLANEALRKAGAVVRKIRIL